MVFFVDITERVESQRALRQRAAHARFLNQIGEEIAGERTTEGVLERAVHLAQETFDLHQVAVLLLDGERQVLEVAAVASPIDDAACEIDSLAIGEGITGYVAQRNETVVVGDVSTDPRYVRLFPGRGVTRSEMAVPIRIRERVAGVLDVQSPVYEAFGSGERVVLETLADQIAVGLENARLYQALQEELIRREEVEQALRRSIQRLETVHEIDQAILGAKSPEEVAKPLLERVRQLVPCERASIDVFDFEAGEVQVIAAIQTVGQNRVAAGTCFPITQRQLAYQLLGRQRVVHLEDIRRLPQSSPLISALCKDGIRSALVGGIRAQDELIGMLSLGSCRLSGFRREHEPIVAELADTAGIAMQQARLFDSIRQHRERLRETMARLAEAEETERRHVVRELHDRVGQNLTALDINLSVVRSNLETHSQEELEARIDDSLSLVAQTNQMIRQLMIDLRPPVLDDYGLLPTLHWYGDRVSLRTGITVEVRGREEDAADLSPHVENALFRIAQEALNNITKHARADRVTITLAADEEELRLTIRDDGAGFHLEGEREERKSWGLLTMRERADSVGARCRIESDLGKGTCVIVEVPV
jgi:signal transduction histidine kinase/putative methionine-R-sulfoxide reductase with GAF domain